ncbi:MAG: phosphopyruvate hydratase [Candidatus Pacebacteria bacterium]|nr:phosphopyruvate hydratase [Candidatus Paceibacterota bacterium]
MQIYMKIKSIKAREILDSRGNPTIEVDCLTDIGVFTSAVPSGASTGKNEAFELRDGGRRYGGKGVLKAVNNINEIIGPKIIGADCTNQKEIDDIMIELDGTEGKYNLGANAIVGVSMAVCRAGACASSMSLHKYIAYLAGNKELKLPYPCFNIINGGAHADNDLDFQEFMIVPQANSFRENLRIGSEVFYQLKKILKEKYHEISIGAGDEGGFAPMINLPEVALSFIMKAIDGADYTSQVKIILDVAATQFYRKRENDESGFYRFKTGFYSSAHLLNYYADLVNDYPIIGIEDPFAEEDWNSFKKINQRLGKKIMIVGDDLTVSNPELIKKGIEEKACNAVILKINQIGTVSEIIESARIAKENNWKIIVSHRSGETCDTFISDLAVGISAEYIKSGAPNRGERLAKYNRLCKIEDKNII